MNLSETEKRNLLKTARKIILCIVRNRAERIDQIFWNTSLNHDLGLEGDDVDDLLNDIQKKVSIDFSSLNFETYFYSEGNLPIQSLAFILLFPFTIFFFLLKKLLELFGFDSFGSRFFRITSFSKNKKSFRVGSLIAAGFFGKWDESNFENSPIEKELQAWQKEFQFRFQRRYKREV